MISLIYCLDVLSSWCFYSEPNLRRLLDLHGKHLRYEWRIALVTDHPRGGFSREQYDWFYRRSGSISGTRLNSGWRTADYASSVEPNLAAEAARELGFSDDRVRLAISRAALIEGKPVLERATLLQIVSAATGVEAAKIAEMMDAPQMRERIEKSCAEFEALGVTQRPAYVLRSDIEDSAIFSGVWLFEPLNATIQAMLSDAEKYAHFEANNAPMPGERGKSA
ncbi:MAG: disulfide bond formation protein DsbA [Candidatus Eremiobacteraeota bacterium]|nr:disulfide bond formation protein DsbA [Candidatus Eremiobacteraeota bacterium]